MKQRAFLDTNIIFDLLGRRDPYYAPAAALFTAIEKGMVEASASSLTYANLHYVLRKTIGSGKAVEALKSLRKLVAILPVDDAVIVHALDSTFIDFEDAIQYHTALANNFSYLVTRNQKVFRSAKLSIVTAEECLAQISA
ncbi:MAG: PIN domain-containing protein [Desulfobulbaceae bacterium]|nr:PIN domain-containing protein [Desulfobulbaceae bacterium]